MPSTYYLYDRYGTVAPSLSGIQYFAKAKYDLAPVILQGTTNQVFSYDATSDYNTFGTTGCVAQLDYQRGTFGVAGVRYMLDGSSPTPNIKIPSSSYYDTGTNGYKTASLRVYSEYALSFRLDINLQDSGGNPVGSTDSTSVTVSPNTWTDIIVSSSGQGQRVLATLNVTSFNSSTDSGKVFYVDAAQIENLKYATPFNNSTTRTAGNISYTIPVMGPDYTALCWTVAGPQTSTFAGGDHPFFTLYNTSTNYATLNYQKGSTKVQAFKDDTDPNTDLQISGITGVNPGDILFGALVNDGLSMTVYFAKSTDASLQTVSGSTDFDTFSQIFLGRDPSNSRWANGPIEQFLLYNRALTQAEVLEVFQSATPLDYSSDKRIVFASGTPSTIATFNGLGVAGTGQYRTRDLTASLDIVSATGVNTTYSNIGNSTHIVYGADVDKLYFGSIISTGTNLQTSSIYKVDQVMNITNIGKTAYVTKL